MGKHWVIVSLLFISLLVRVQTSMSLLRVLAFIHSFIQQIKDIIKYNTVEENEVHVLDPKYLNLVPMNPYDFRNTSPLESAPTAVADNKEVRR